jgi:hypothetical protein
VSDHPVSPGEIGRRRRTGEQVVHLVRHQPHLVHAQLQLGGRYLLVDAIIAGSSDTNDATLTILKPAVLISSRNSRRVKRLT